MGFQFEQHRLGFELGFENNNLLGNGIGPPPPPPPPPPFQDPLNELTVIVHRLPFLDFHRRLINASLSLFTFQ